MDQVFIQNIFAGADRNADGQMDRREFSLAFGTALTPFFDKYDLDKDGELSLDECFSALEKAYG
jgi:Ca2+-binding EF-hand superfamily protein